MRFIKYLNLWPPSGLVLISAMLLSVGTCTVLKSFLFWIHSNFPSKCLTFPTPVSNTSWLKNLWRCNGPPLSQAQIQELSQYRYNLTWRKLWRVTLLSVKINLWSSVSCCYWTVDNCSLHGNLATLTFCGFAFTPVWIWECFQSPIAFSFLHIAFSCLETQLLDNSPQSSSSILRISSGGEAVGWACHSWSQVLHCKGYIKSFLT